MLKKSNGLFVLGLTLLLVVPALAQDMKAPAAAQTAPAMGADSESQVIADIQRLINLTGGEKMGQQMLEQMVFSLRQSGINVPDEFWKEFLAESDMKALTQKMVPIYRKFLTHQQIKDIITFYESPTGKYLLETMPKLMEESYGAGQEWGKGVSDRVRAKLIQKGYIDEQGNIVDQSKKSGDAVPSGSAAPAVAGSSVATTSAPAK